MGGVQVAGSDLRSVTDARWSCGGCGFCCRFHQLGPVEPEIIAGLEATAPQTWWPPAAAGWKDSSVGPGGRVTELRKVDGHCVFLDDDQRCAVHARLGPQAKPGFCRLFPYQIVEDRRGLAVVVRSSCGGLVSSSQDGQPVAQASQAVELAAAGKVVIHWAPARVPLRPGWQVPLDVWMDWEDALLTWLDSATGGPRQLVAGVRGLLQTLAQEQRWPLDAQTRAAATLQAGDPARAQLAARAALMALELTLSRVQQTETPPNQAEADFLAALLQHTRTAGASLQDNQPLVLQPDAADYVRQRLASAVLGKDIHRLGGVFAGLGRFLIGVEIAARSAASLGPVDAQRFAEIHTRVVRFTLNRSVNHVLTRARPALDDLACFVCD